MKYIVMSVKDSYVVLLDENGMFVYAANRGYTKGEVIFDPILMMDHSVKPLFRLKPIFIGVLGLTMVLLLFFGVTIYINTIRIISSVYLTINPQVRLDINTYGNVIDVVGLNEDGKRLVEDYDAYGQNQYDVSLELIDRAMDMGFLSDGDTIVIRIDAPDDVTFTDMGIHYRTSLQDHLHDQVDVTIQVVDDAWVEPKPTPTFTSTPTPTSTPLPTATAAPTPVPTPVPTSVPTPVPTAIPQQSDYGASDYEDGGSSDDDGSSNYGSASDYSGTSDDDD